MAKYYSDYYNEIIKNDVFTENLKLKSSILTMYIGHEFFIDRFAISTNIGYNIYKPFRKQYIEDKEEDLEDKIKSCIQRFNISEVSSKYLKERSWDVVANKHEDISKELRKCNLNRIIYV